MEEATMRHTILLALATTLLAGSAMAYGSHDSNCIECHSLHYAKGKGIISVAPNTAEKNPGTGKSAEDDAALCLGCHNEKQGIMPIMLSSTHPVGMKPNKVVVPANLLRPNGTLGCMSCHDPHPSNPNYKYLQGDVKKKGDMGKFCALCHKDKTEAAVAAAPAPAAAPKKATP
jgi:predicted CXXCH cytochrome family protein